MKLKTTLPIIIVLMCSCSFLSSPTSTVKKFMTAAEKGDVDGMNKLFSSKAIDKIGVDKIRSNNQSFSEMSRKAHESGDKYQFEDLQEKRNGNTARVSFLYRNQNRNDSIRMVFDLSKEGGTWKIDDIGGGDKEESTGQSSVGEEAPKVVEPPPPPVAVNPDEQVTGSAPIAGGHLNGKATSLPEPPYPPVAKAAKAEGTVTVEVVVDENGN